MLLTQLCLEPMRRSGGGVVINIASSCGIGYAA
jgi:short-subunit dehydrogenase